MITWAIIILVSGLVFLLFARQIRRSRGLPEGKIIYSDTNEWEEVNEPLYDPELALTGRPDYLVFTRNQIIPVEFKTNSINGQPYPGHIYQLAAYCRLVESAYGTRPDYGILHYSNHTFRINYTAKLEADLHNILEEIHSKENTTNVRRSHKSSARCHKCGFNRVCNDIVA